MKVRHRSGNLFVSCEVHELFRNEIWFVTEGGQTHPLDEMDVLITVGTGSGLQAELAIREIERLVTTEKDPKLAVKMRLRGTLPVAEIEEFHDTDDCIEDLSRLPNEVWNTCCGNTDLNGGCCGRGLRGLV